VNVRSKVEDMYHVEYHIHTEDQFCGTSTSLRSRICMKGKALCAADFALHDGMQATHIVTVKQKKPKHELLHYVSFSSVLEAICLIEDGNVLLTTCAQCKLRHIFIGQ